MVLLGSRRWPTHATLVGLAACAVVAVLIIQAIRPALNTSAIGTAPPLGTAASFAVLAGSTVTNTGLTIVAGNLGVSPGTAVTGFPPGIVLAPGTIHAADAVALQAKTDLTTAYNVAAAEPCDQTFAPGQDLGG